MMAIEIRPGYITVVVTCKDGVKIEGSLTGVTLDNVIILTNDGRRVSISKLDIEQVVEITRVDITKSLKGGV